AKKNKRRDTAGQVNKIVRIFGRSPDSGSPLDQRSQHYPAEQGEYERRETLENQAIPSAKNRFPEVHSGGIRSMNPRTQYRQPHQHNRRAFCSDRKYRQSPASSWMQ